MLHFCSVSDVTSVMPSVASRFGNIANTTRDAVTQDIINFLRRNLDYNAAVVEYHNMKTRCAGDRMDLYLAKWPVDTTVAFDIRVDYYRNFDTDTQLTAGQYEWDAERSRLVIIPPFDMRYQERAIRVQFAGGFQPDSSDPTLYNCGASIKEAAMMEASFRIETLLNRQQGAGEEQARGTGGRPIKMKPLVGGLLPEVAFKLEPYRRKLGA